jgi:hypothetical protein
MARIRKCILISKSRPADHWFDEHDGRGPSIRLFLFMKKQRDYFLFELIGIRRIQGVVLGSALWLVVASCSLKLL